ncbi:carbon storage regulator homolog [endosymbiont of Euscepes postfasciatus]|uniref:carbon storage regulator CsrA n=1 Tax=endosymbiont of Euscepes postfasciatus TaxID=650377 RepID=UPI000DC6F00E|nr:carbon storage regulator CsrA [endosymbiont of Euscepes postfasciatus]BBA84706.1 carbon storage regulator homolog [endosymbiont of Euscepes postfasciatus]
MLILTRKCGEKLIINNDIIITILNIKVKDSQIKIGIDAPKLIKIYREEIFNKIKKNI